MKILFLNLPSPPKMNVARDFLGYGVATPSKRLTYGHDGHVVPPLFEAYAAAILENIGFKVSVLDAQVRNLDLPLLLMEVQKRKPQVVVCRMSIPSFKEDVQVLSRLRGILPDAIQIGWGTLCAIEPKRVLNESSLDIAIQDELEFTIPNVIEALEKSNWLQKVEGISFKSNGKIISSQRRPLQKDLDVLPLPAYHLLDMDKYMIKESRFSPGTKDEKLTRFFSVVSSRGCPFNCTYCPYPLGFGKVWRGLSPKKTVDEIEHLVSNYDIHGIWFRDQTFTMDMKRALRICDGILERRLDIRWTCETRADKLTKDLVIKMKKAGCVWISMGVETGDPHLLHSIGKRGNTLETIENAFKITKEEGILRKAFVMVGLPGESWKTIQNTRMFLEKINPDALTVDIVTPYLGTQLFEMAERKNWLISKDWSIYTSVDPIMSFNGFSSEDMKRARRYLLDQVNIEGKIKRITNAIKEHRFQDALLEIKPMIFDYKNNIWRLYNVISCRLR